MKKVVGPYKYDLFFSYSWAAHAQDGGLRDWSRMVIDSICALLKQRFNSAHTNISVYLDRDEVLTGDDLDVSITEAIHDSALTVLLVSRFSDSPTCQREIEALLSFVGIKSLKQRASILRIQRVDTKHWLPEIYRASGPSNLSWLDLCDEAGPLNIAEFGFKAPMPDLAKPVQGAFLEIAKKLDDLRKAVEQQNAYQASQKLPDAPVMYFEGEAPDRIQWNLRANSLKAAPCIVWPEPPKPATEDTENIYGLCDAVVLFRNRENDNIAERIGRAYLGRRNLLKSRKRTIPWALLDERDEPPPAAIAYDIPRVRPVGDWVDDLRRTLVV